MCRCVVFIINPSLFIRPRNILYHPQAVSHNTSPKRRWLIQNMWRWWFQRQTGGVSGCSILLLHTCRTWARKLQSWVHYLEKKKKRREMYIVFTSINTDLGFLLVMDEPEISRHLMQLILLACWGLRFWLWAITSLIWSIIYLECMFYSST